MIIQYSNKSDLSNLLRYKAEIRIILIRIRDPQQEKLIRQKIQRTKIEKFKLDGFYLTLKQREYCGDARDFFLTQSGF